MGLFPSDSEKIYCAFCKIDRRTYKKKGISLQNVLLSFVLSGLVMFIFWQGFNPKVFILFSVFLFLSEFFVQMRWRFSVVCPFCKFDPVLYLRNKRRASKQVQRRLQEIKNKEDLFLSKNPFQNLPFRKVSKEELNFKSPQKSI